MPQIDDKNPPHKKHILIAEDNPVVAKTIELTLAKIGYDSTSIASDGQEAIEMAISQRPDVILMDIEMPKVNGLEAIKRILEQYFVPIVIVTAHEDRKFVDQASNAGAVAFLTKPPKAAEMERAIKISLARHRDLEELRRVNRELGKALEEIKTLRGIIPICASCKKIRDDQGYWNQIESYISAHSQAKFSHGICPDCMQKLYPDLGL